MEVDKLKVSVVVTIFVRNSDDATLPSRCGFYDKDGKIYLPSAPVTYNKHAHEVAVDLIRHLLPIDLKLIHITPVGFFDPIINEENGAEREILLGYRVIVSPGMPVLKELEFKDNDELGIVAGRISENHHRVFRAALYY